MPVPTAPTDLRLYQYPSGTSAQLLWTDRSTDEDGFVVERQLVGEADFTSIGIVNAANGVNNGVFFTDTGLPPETVAAYRVRAVNPLGSSGYTNIVSVPTAPAAPAGLTAAAVAGTDNQIRLAWTDGSRSELVFRLYRKNPGSTNFSQIGTIPSVAGTGGAGAYTDTGATAGATHEYYVTAYNAAGESGESNRVTVAANPAVTAPAAPGGLVLWQYLSGTAFRAYFSDQSTNEDAFLLERKSEDEGDYSVVATLPAAAGTGTQIWQNVTDLAADTSFSFRVRARNSVGDSSPSTVLVFASAPAAPADLSAAAVAGTDNQIRLTWSDRSRRESGFRVYRRNPASTSFTPISTVPGVAGTGTTVSYVDGSVTAGSAYEYHVRAYNDAGESGESNRATATANATSAPPAAPSELLLWAYASATSLQFRFRDNSTNEDSFVVERKAEGEAEYVAAAAPPAVLGVGGYTLFTVSGLAPDTRYEVRIRARNAVGESAPSNVVAVDTAPTAPGGLTAAAVAGTDNAIRLTWTDTSRYESGFRVYRKNPGAASFVPITTVPGVTGTGGAVAYTDTGATAGGTHEYYVKAYNNAGESPESDHATVTANPAATVPAAPSELQLWGYLSATSFQFRFRDNSTNEAGFVVERKTEDEAEYAVVGTAPATAGAGNYALVTVTAAAAPDTNYSYRVKARNSIGDSAPSNVATVATVPVPASNLAATALSSSQVRLTWTDNSRYEASYYVYRKNPGGTAFGYIGNIQGNAGRGGTVTYVDVNLTASTRYEYYVVAQNGAGASAPSESAAATTSAANAPGTPTNLTAAPVQRQVTLRWLDRSTDEALFVVERQAEGETSFSQIATAPARPGATDFVFYADGDLAFDTAFAYRVKARNASGDSAYTNVATATTAPAAPVDLAATALANTDNQIRLAWTNTSKHAAGFYVYRKRAGEAAFTNVGFVAGAAGVGVGVTFVSSALIPLTAYTYYVVAYNDAGESPRSNEASATTLATDNTPPDTFIAGGPAEGGFACVSNPTFTFAGSDNYTPAANLRYQHRVDSGAWTAPAAGTTATLTGLSDGGHRLEVAALDEAGNVDPSPAVRTFVVDTVAPAVTNVRVAGVTATTATLAWDTNKPADARVDYRAAGAADWTSMRRAGAPASAHTVVLLGLRVGTTYEYRARSVDVCDREAVSGVATFATPGVTAPPDTRITDGPGQGATVGVPSVRFAWAGADDVTPAGQLQFQWQLDAAPWSAWSAATERTFTDLAEGAHTFSVRSRDAEGNEDATPAARAFVVDLSPPALSNVAVAVRDGDALVTWTTNQPATSRVEYGPTAAYGSSTPPNTGLQTRHEVRITGLEPGATYHFRVRSTNAFGREQVSADATFVFTRLVPDLQVAAVTAPPEVLTDRAFDLAWTLTNAGTGRAGGPWLDRVYLSRDAGPGDGDPLLAEFVFAGPLEAGQSAQRTQAVTVPRTRVPADGAYHLVVVTDALNRVDELGGEDDNVRTTAVRVRRPPLPDLVVAAVSAPERAFFGQTIGVEWTVTNAGAAATDAPEWHDQVLLSPSPTPAGGDAVARAEVLNVSYLNAGESYRGRATVQVPRGLTGRYHVIVTADARGRVAEADETNNAASRPIELQLPPVPDLRVTQVQAAEEAYAGGEMRVAWRVENRGTGAVPPGEATWTDAVYLSTDDEFNPRTARLLGEFAHTGALAPGEGYAQSQTVRVPKSVTGGDYRVFVQADGRDQVYEYLFGSNNVEHDRRRPTRVVSTPPDLVVTAITAPAEAEAGRAVDVSWTVTNQAAFTAEGSWVDAVYVSDAPTLNVRAAALVTTVPRSGTVDAGASYTASVTAPLPACLSGRQYLFVVTDSTNALFEFDPTADAEQNASAPHELAVTSRPPDLGVTEVVTPAGGAAGQPIPVSWTVRNIGVGPTLVNAWTDRVLLSRTPTLDAAAVRLGAFRRDGGLAAGAAYSRTEVVTLPRQAQGAYYVLVQADADGVVNECGAEANNVGGGARAIDVGADLPNLEVIRLDAPKDAVMGRKVALRWSVANAGGAAVRTPAWTDAVYLSSEPAVERGDEALATVLARGPLEVGAAYSASAEVTVPNVPPGTYYLVVAADQGDHVFEGAREGNVAVVPVTLAPPDVDLRVTAVDAPETAYSGQALEVAWTVTNAGAEETPVADWIDTVVLSRDQTPDPSDPVVGYAVRRGALAGGASYTGTGSVSVPRGLSGPYFLFVRADARDAVPETDEVDNTSAARAVQLELPPPADLVVTDVVVPADGAPGEPATFRWTVRNASGNPATGQWEDVLYLSQNETWDVGDPLVGRVAHEGPLAPGASYEATLTAVLPALTEGRYRAIVRTDVRNTVRETADDNNTGVSAAEMAVGVPELTLGTSLASDLRAGQERYYRVRVPAGETLRVALDSEAADAANELYVRFGAAPSRVEHDAFFAQPNEEDQEAVVPTTRAGEYYVLVRGGSASDAAAPFTLVAELVPFGARRATPNQGGAGGSVTVAIEGAKFTGGTVAALRRGDRVVLAVWQELRAADALMATFDLRDVPPGAYDVQVSKPVFGGEVDPETGQTTFGVFLGEVQSLAGGFEVVAAAGGTEINLETPATVRAGARFVFYVSVRNESLNDVPAPIIAVASPSGTPFSVNPDASRAATVQHVVATGARRRTVLAPGEVAAFPFYVQASAGGRAEFATSDLSDSRDAIDWGALEATYRDGSDAVTWARTWANFRRLAGDSWATLGDALRLVADQRLRARGADGAVGTELIRDLLGTARIGGELPREGGTVATASSELTQVHSGVPSAQGRREALAPDHAGEGRGRVEAMSSDGPSPELGAALGKIYAAADPCNPSETSLTPVQLDLVRRWMQTEYLAADYAWFDLAAGRAGYDDPVSSHIVGLFLSGQGAPATDPLIYGPGTRLSNAIREHPATLETGSRSITGKNHLMATLSSVLRTHGCKLTPDTPLDAETDVIGRFIPTSTQKFPNTTESPNDRMFRPDIFYDSPFDLAGHLPGGVGGEQEWNTPGEEGRREPRDGREFKADVIVRREECKPGSFRYWAEVNLKLTISEHFDVCPHQQGEGEGLGTPLERAVTKPMAALEGHGYAKDVYYRIVAEWPTEIIPIAGGDLAPECKPDCPSDPGPPGGAGRPGPSGGTDVRRAVDPNDKVGPQGFGPQRHVGARQPLPYTVNFENVPTATATAQRVRVTDRLAPELDWRTFRLTEVGFGPYRVPVPENRSFFQTRIQLGEDLGNLLADVSAGLDIRTGQVRLTLTAVDPATGEPPESAALGLLPPNDAANRGQGFVRYTVRPRAGLPTGTVVTSPPATIVFDTEPPIDTNAVTNTLDAGAPASRVAPLPAEVPNTLFAVSWSGDDDSPDGSGLAGFNVFVSEGDGPFTLWRNATTDTSATYSGAPGRTYRFYSVARDNAGNVEAAPAEPQASTRVSDSPTNPAPVLDGLAPASVEAGGPAFVLVVNGQNFVDGSEVLWNGEPRPTTFVSATRLAAVIAATDVASAGTISVTVASPAPGGGTSGARDFVVTAPVVGTPTLLVSGASARRAADTLVVDVVLANSGTGGATNVRLLDTTLLNDVAPSGALPDPVTLAGGGSATVSLTFPGTAAEPGSRVTLKVAGTSDQGAFAGSRRVDVS